MNSSNNQDIELEILNNQNLKPKALDNQNIESEVLDNQNLESEILDNQDIELEVLAVYNNINNLFDIDNFDDIKEFFVDKAFKS
ncbi:24009_t:CDS:2 [Racocetra persica]|uniref:24009_t:CDS:1 n=1 Tax=Racocetra persica TaxID=160502 RepID=A0ACA9QQH5_9GLOM|nr:24009_t:CDS:2 [Racocetra persica]